MIRCSDSHKILLSAFASRIPTLIRMPTTSRTRLADLSKTRLSPSRPSKSRATPIATIIGSATTTTCRFVPCSTCSTPDRRAACSRTSLPQWAACPTSSSSANWVISTRFMPTTAKACAKRWPRQPEQRKLRSKLIFWINLRKARHSAGLSFYPGSCISTSRDQ